MNNHMNHHIHGTARQLLLAAGYDLVAAFCTLAFAAPPAAGTGSRRARRMRSTRNEPRSARDGRRAFAVQCRRAGGALGAVFRPRFHQKFKGLEYFVKRVRSAGMDRWQSESRHRSGEVRAAPQP